MKRELQADGLTKRYRGRTVVDEVSLTVSSGEIVGLLGANGAGKTTVFSILTGLVTPDHGVIMLDGQDISREQMHIRARAGVGYLPQESSVFRKLGAADNIRVSLEQRKDLDKAARTIELEKLLDEFNLQQVRDIAGGALSGGERRRVEIARALAVKPSFILLDEPFAGVDPISVGEIQKSVVDLRNRNLGLLMTDHNVRETLRICDRAYIMDHGKIIALGSVAEVIADQHVRDVYLGGSFTV